MIKLSSIINEIKVISPSDFIRVTNEGRKAYNEFHKIYDLSTYFDSDITNIIEGIEKGTGNPKTSKVWSAGHLEQLINEGIIDLESPKLTSEIIKDHKEVYGDDEDSVKQVLEKLINVGYLRKG